MYLHGRFLLTDDRIPYNRNGGVFGRINPKNPVDLKCGKYGAWEIATQVSYLDLNDIARQTGTGPGRTMTNISAALNWHINSNAKMHFEAINTSLDDRVFGSSTVNTYASMVQFDF